MDQIRAASFRPLESSMTNLRSVFAVGAALLALALPGFAQARPQAAPQGEPAADLFGETIDVRVVNVEVVVTDREGNRVTGLSPGDFKLRVDGKEIPIDYFTEVRGGDAVAPGPEVASPVQGLPSLAPGTPVGTSYLVFIDDFFSITARRDEVLRRLKDDVTRLGPEDRMAVVAYDGRDLEMLTSWSSSTNALTRVFDVAMTRPAHGLERLAEQRTFESSRRVAFNAASGRLSPVAQTRDPYFNRLDLEEEAYAERLSYNVHKAVTAAVSTLRGFAAPPGRKVLLLLSGGWPYSPADWVVNNPNRAIIDRNVARGEELLSPLADTANRLGYTIYSVDVPGLEFVGADAEAQLPNDADDSSGNVTNLPIREQELHASLEFVAQQTGGKALLNGRREEALTVAESDTRSYYWLGFTPPFKGDDARHDVKVEVQRPGLTVRSRGNFLDLSRRGEVSLMVESAMLFGDAPGAEKLPAELGTPVKTGRREMEVPVTLAIPTSAVTTVPVGGDGRHAAKLELRIAALDEKGDRSEIPVIPLELTLDRAPEPGKFFKYETRLRLRRVAQHLVIAVFDPLGGKILTFEADVRPVK
jgi:VWFA-related protein